MWTTEWVHHDGTRKTQNILESKLVGKAFIECFGKNVLLRKTKRKRDDSETANVPATKNDTLAIQATHDETVQDPVPTEKDIAPEEPVNDATAPVHEESQIPTTSVETATTTKESDTTDLLPDPAPVHEESHFPNTSAEPATKTQGADPRDLLHNLHFYLLRPMTTAKLKCLIPISQTLTLKDVLQGRTVLEFPTFYVRQEPPEALLEPFITAERYDSLYGEEIPIELPAYNPNVSDFNEPPASLADIDEKKVLEVLQKDLTA